MQTDALHRSETIEREAWADLFEASEGTSAARLGSATLLRAPAFDHPLFNRALGLGVGAPADEAEVEAIAAAYAQDGVGRYFVHVSPLARPRDVAVWLEEHGLARYPRSWVTLHRKRGPFLAPPRDLGPLTLREASREDAGEVGRILAAGFDLPEAAGGVFAAAVGRPGWCTFVVSDEDRPIAAGLLFVRERTAYLAGGSTLPPYRGRGAQGALVRARVALALELGCDLVTTETGERVPGDPQHSYRNLIRAGFAPAAVRDNYAPRGVRAWKAEPARAWHDAAAHDAEAPSLRRTRA